MSELAAIQSVFAAALVPGERVAGAMPLFSGDAGRIARGLEIYRGNVQANAMKALAAIYPVTKKIVDAEFFDGLAREFARQMPSSSGDLNEYGESFNAFLAGFAPAQELPYLPDVARLEWMVHRAHYAQDHPVLDIKRFGDVAEDGYTQLRLALHPACQLLDSDWPLARIWQIHQDGYADEFSVDMDAGPSHTLVFRPRLRVEVRNLQVGEQAFLGSIVADDGATLGDALNAALAADPGFRLDIVLAGWVGDRVVIDFRSP
jgi:hypothetical protein